MLLVMVDCSRGTGYVGGYSSDPDLDCRDSVKTVADGMLHAAKEAQAAKVGLEGGAWPSPVRTGSNAAFYVEMRDDPILVPTIVHYLDRLPAPEWSIVVWHGNLNQKTLEMFVLKHAEGGRVLLVNLEHAGVGVAMGSSDLSTGRGHYNCLLTNSAMWEAFPVFEWILVVQGDTRLCSGSNFDINHFTKMPYHYYGGVGPQSQEDFRNGGFSLRRRNFMATIISRGPKMLGSGAEDVYFGRRMLMYDLQTRLANPGVAQTVSMAPFNESQQFSYLYHPNGSLFRSFGVHKPQLIPNLLGWSRMTSFCPEVNEIYIIHGGISFLNHSRSRHFVFAIVVSLMIAVGGFCFARSKGSNKHYPK